MNPIRTMIVDDEEPALQRLERLLRLQNDLVLCGSYSNSMDASSALCEEKVDLLLLDIEMPGMSGIELLHSMDESKRPLVVFITAYDNYAVKAFEYYAIDYLLKPFSNERFEKMLNRVREYFTSIEKRLIPWNDVMDAVTQQKLPGARIAVKTGKKYDFIEPGDIAYICADGNYCDIKLNSGAKFVHRETITNMIATLPAGKFLRVHHSYIVSIAAIRQVMRLAFGELEVIMNDGKILKVSRKYKQQVSKLISK
jgi:two-component system LytT family response regulator